MSNQLTIQVLGNLDLSPVEAFEYYPGETRTLVFKVIDEETQQNFQTFLGDFKQGSITSFSDAGGGFTTVNSANHLLSNNTYIYISGTTNYNGFFITSGVTTNAFNIQKVFVSNDATGLWSTGPQNLLLTIPGSPNDVVINLNSSNINQNDRSVITVNLTPLQTTTMITGFIRFEFDLNDGSHRVAYAPYIQQKLPASGT